MPIKQQSFFGRVRFKTGGKSNNEYVEAKRPLANFHAIPENQVVNVLRKESEKWMNKLEDSEERAIRKYAYNAGDRAPNRFFERLNAMLRGDFLEDEKLREYADIISGAIKKNKLEYDVIAYRGINVNPSEGIEINGLFRAKQFYSTSVIKKKLFGSKYKLEICVKKGSTAAYIEYLSEFPEQRELLLDKECMFRVVSRKENTILLEVI